MYYSYEGLGESTITFPAGEGAAAGKPAMLNASGEAVPAESVFCGVLTEVRGDVAAVQIAGFVRLPYTGTKPTPGYQTLIADGAGGVKIDSSAATGRSYLVLCADDAEVGFIL